MSNNTENTVDGSGLSEFELEIARENGIEITNTQSSDEPVGEARSVDFEEEDSKQVTTEDATSDVPAGEDSKSEETEGEDPFTSLSNESSDEDSDEDDEFKSLPKGFKKRLKRETRKVGRLERELAELKNLIQQQSAQSNTQEVDRNKFATQQEYEAYKSQLEAYKKIQQQEQEQSIRQREAQVKLQSWQEKINSNFTSDDELMDYQESLQALGNPSNYFSEDELTYMFSHKAGPKMLKYFADHPNAIQVLTQSHPYDKPAIFQKVAQIVANGSQQAPKQLSKAPKPQGGLSSNTQGVQTISIDNMSDEELIKLYNSGKFKF